MKKSLISAGAIPLVLLVLVGCGVTQDSNFQDQPNPIESSDSASPEPSESSVENSGTSAPSRSAPAPAAPVPAAPAPAAPAPAAPAPAAPSTATVSTAIRNLLYGHRLACETSEEACLDSIIRNSYPGLMDFENGPTREYFSLISWVDSVVTATPSSIEADPGWVLPPVRCIELKLDVSRPLPGDTYLVEVTDPYGTKFDIHFTLLSGKTYFYWFPSLEC